MKTIDHEIFGYDRQCPRVVWYWYYRKLRIMHRERAKAEMDMLIGGVGFMRITANDVNHIRPEAVYQ